MSAPFTRLEGRKVALRPFTASDVTDAYVGWLNDPEVTRFSNQRFRTHDRASCEEYFRSFSGTENLFVSIRAVEGDLAIGTMTAYRVPHHGTCDVGIMIGERAFGGGGYGQEAWNLLTDWLVDSGGVRKLTAGCLASNHGMVRLMERSGLQREAVRVGQEIVEGRPEDIVLYARFAR